tara:strand:+ start:993 stop:2318 length:1326 start_codon:yes stop_codon:yes gene_type:complete
MLIRSASGLRGIVKDDFSPEIIDRHIASFVANQNITSCVIGRDGRSSGKDITQWVINSLTYHGADVDDCGLATTPTIQLMTEKDKYDGGIIITASHNPAEYNGLKFLQKDGTFLSPDQCNTLFLIADSQKFLRSARRRRNYMGRRSQYDSANAEHIAKVIDATCIDSKSIASKQFKVVVDAVNGAGSTILPKLCEDLGCHVTTIHCNGDGNFTRVAEPLAPNLKDLERKVVEVGADIGFATDPDGDRLSIVSNKGEAIGEEYSLVLAFKNFIKYENSRVVTNLSTSQMIDNISSGSIRTKIGEAYVVEKMKALNIPIGGEGNGGVILKEVHLGRDSLVATAMVLNLLSKENKPINEMINEIPQYIFIKDKVDIDDSIDFDSLATLFDCDEINRDDGIKFSWPKKWIHIRKSNTEPIIRIFAEAKTKNETKDLIQTLKDYLK